MNKAKTIAAAALLMLAGACGSAPPRLEAGEAWARESNSASTAAYLAIANKGGSDDWLLSVQSDKGSASLHVTSMENGIARMRSVSPDDGLVIPAGEKLILRPGGAHIMLSGLEQPLRPGATVSMTLNFRTSAALPVEVAVRPAGEMSHGGH